MVALRKLTGPFTLLFVLAMTPLAADAQADRLPVPNSSKQGPALSKLRSDYRAEYAKREGADQLALANIFLKEAAQPRVEPVRQYVLLREARELAVNGGDLQVAFAAIDEMSRNFAIDGEELKVTAMSDAISRSKSPPRPLVDQYLAIAEQALIDGDIQLTFQASRLGTKLARESRDPAAISRAKQVELHHNEVNREIKLAAAAADKLKTHPGDPEANLLVGRYWCFFRGIWEEGLPLLVKGSDPQLAALAKEDLAAADTNATLNAANNWWNRPDTRDTPQRRSRQRAAQLYEKLLPTLNDAQKPLAQQRIAEAKNR